MILDRKTDAKGQIIKFQYDALNRLTMKDYPSGNDTYFNYDEAFSHGHGIGRLTSMHDSGATFYFYADPFGKTVQETRNIGGKPYEIKTSTDALGRLTSVTYPDGEKVAYSYDSGGNLFQAGSYATFYNYTALSQPRLETLGNGMVSTYDYHPLTKRLTDLRVSNGSQDVLHLSHGYDLGGNPTSITNTLDPTKSQTFQYDALDRLKQAQSTAYGTLTYSYDKIGNLTAKEGITFTPDSVRPHAAGTSSDGKSYTYDNNGNMLTDGTRSIVWNYDNLPSSITAGAATTFVYDGMGNRVKKIGPAGTTGYVDKLYELSGGVPVKYIYAGGQRIALKSPTQTLYYHGNHLGSTSLVTDSARNVVETLFYKPFGGTFSDTGSISVNHKYTGQELDTETGLYFYNARYYNPSLGRFISPDTIVPNPADPQAYNRYSYVQNNPIRFIDPSGHNPLDKFFDKVFDFTEDAADDAPKITQEYAPVIFTVTVAAFVVAGGYYAITAMSGSSLTGLVAGSGKAYFVNGVVYTSEGVTIPLSSAIPGSVANVLIASGGAYIISGAGFGGGSSSKGGGSVSGPVQNNSTGSSTPPTVSIPSSPADCHMGGRMGLLYPAPKSPVTLSGSASLLTRTYQFNFFPDFKTEQQWSTSLLGASLDINMGHSGNLEFGLGNRNTGMGVNFENGKPIGFSGHYGPSIPASFIYGTVVP